MNLLEKYQTEYENSVIINHDPERDYYVVRYLHGGVDFSDQLLRQARGLILDKDGNILARGFEKFFNHNQYDADNYTASQYDENFKDVYTRVDMNPHKKYTFYEKLDGSLIHATVIDNDYLIATTSSCNRAVNHYLGTAEYILKKRMPEDQHTLKKEMEDKTFLYEYVSPNNPIVVNYDTEDLVLLGIVETSTGRRLSNNEVDEINNTFKNPFTRPQIYELTIPEAIEIQKTKEDFEGFVMENDHGKLIKFKTDDWFNMKSMTDIFFGNQITEAKINTILEIYLKDEIDDLLAFQNKHELYKRNNIVGKVVDKAIEIENTVNKLIDGNKGKSFKEIGQSDIDPDYKSMVFLKLRGNQTYNRKLIQMVKDEFKTHEEKTVKVLIGAPGVGKSSYVRENIKEGDLWLSSDNLRIEMYGSLEEGNKHNNEVFKEMHRRLHEFLETKTGNVYYDATNLSRKLRTQLFNDIRRINPQFSVEAVLIHKPLAETLEQNNKREGFEKVPEDVVTRMYKTMQPPKPYLDCHKIRVVAPDFSKYENEIYATYDESHYSPYHKETIREHVDMVIANADDDLKTVAEFHDLGKSICRNESLLDRPQKQYFKDVNGKYHNFFNHENVSAIYHLAAHRKEINRGEKQVLVDNEVIYQHMRAHDGFSEKYISKNKLNSETLDKLTRFAEADSKSKILDDNYQTFVDIRDGKLAYIDGEVITLPDITLEKQLGR